MKTRKQKGAMSYLSPDELLKVLRVAKEHSLRDWCMVLLSYHHGLRASEVCCLELDEAKRKQSDDWPASGYVNLKDGVLYIERAKDSLSTTQPLYPHKGQPLLDEVKALKAYLAERRKTGSNALFVSQKGKHLDRSAWNRIFKAIAKEAGLPPEKRHCHVLKHSLANHLVRGNVNLALVKQSLGHANIQSTMKYLGVTDAEASEATTKALMDIF